ncbi:MAG: biopolymer transporter ExbD [Verrucomicrobiota bacterium]|nr:biopolymer transporter ExbD [Verrucomicrobiota bacterium]
MEVTSPIPKKHARIEIIPLIDIMFFLLASFMMVSLSQTTMKGIKVALPTGASGQTQSKKDYYSFSVDRAGYIYWDKAKITYEDVPGKLKPIYAEWLANKDRPEPKIFVRGDRETLHGNVTRLLDQIRSTGFTKIAFEIKSEALKGVPAPGSN